MTSKVKITSSGRRVLRMLEGFDDVNKDLVETLAATVAGRKSRFFNPSGKQALIIENFKKRFRTQRTFTKLKPATIKQKIRKRENFMLVSSGKLRKAVNKNTKGKIVGNRANIKAKVPDYGEFNNEGKGNLPQRQFYTFKDDKFFQDLSESILVNILRIRGLKVRR